MSSANNNCRFCLRIFEDMEERIGITSQISDEFRNITQTEVIIIFFSFLFISFSQSLCLSFY